MSEISIDNLTQNWKHWPFESIPLDKPVIAMWKSHTGEWKSGKFQGYEFYKRQDQEPFNDIPVRWIYANQCDEVVNVK